MNPYEEALRRIRRAKEIGAKVLDLGNLGLEVLPEELGELTALRMLALGWTCPKSDDAGEFLEFLSVQAIERPGWLLSDLGALRRLSSLTWLDMSNCVQLTHVVPLRGLTSLTSLDLSGCLNLEDVEPLRQLSSLTSLNLQSCTKLYDVEPLNGLTSLTSLNLSGCENLKDVELRGLTSLTSLDLSRCENLKVVELRGLTSLTSLNLSGCENLKDVELRGLTSLTSLNLQKCSVLKDVEPLRGLISLTSLNLSDCRNLTNIEPLSGLISLTSLALRYCVNLRHVEPLRGLTSLTSLDLNRCFNLEDVEPLSGLISLTSLNLSECEKLKDVEPLRHLTSLRLLDLVECGHLGSFEPILERLPTLSGLYLQGFLEASTFKDLAPEVYTTEPFQNVIDKVRAHFADLERGQQLDTEIKIFVLGNGGVGKSHLCNRLMRNPYPADPASIPSTHGIQIAEFDLDIEAPQPARVNLWDFGGQEIYHGSHALFLQQRAVFVVLWTPDRESGTFHDGVPMRHRPLQYWLDYVRNVAGDEARVLVVQSQCDDDDQVAPLPCPLPADFKFIRPLTVSSRTGLGLRELRGAMAGSIEKLFRKRLPMIGVGRVEVRRRLRELAATRRTLSLDEYRELCAEEPTEADGSDTNTSPLVSNPDALLSFLHESGVVFHKAHLFNSRIILDQNWALEAIYTLLDRGKTLPVLDRHGRFTRETLKALIWPDKTDSDCDALIDMMKSCGICFEVERGEYVAPELLPPYSDALEPMLGSLRNDPDYLGFVVEYPFLHDGILRDMLSRLGSLAGKLAIYWKYGCWFRESNSECDVIIESVFDGDRGHVTARAWGRDPERALQSTYRLMSGHGLAIEPKTRFVHFAGFDDRREVGTIVAGPPDPATAGKQVYLSYAWGEDSTEIGRLREQAAVRAIERLTAVGYAVTYDRKDMRVGDLISAFITRIGKSPDVVAILSQKYLESPYCVKELYSLFLSALRDRSAFVRSIHPIPLTDARLGDREAWRRYKKHWEEKKAELEELFPHGSDGGILTSLEISHWLLDLTTVLSHIGDKLSPSVTDEDLDKLIDRVLAMLRDR